MIIDCHSHIWPDIESLRQAQSFDCIAGNLKASSQQHNANIEPAEKVFVLGFKSNILHSHISNDYILEYMKNYPDKIIGFAGIEPTDNDALEQIKTYQQQGFKGITLSPACQGLNPCDSRIMAIYELAEELSLPIYLLYGHKLPAGAKLENCQPIYLDEAARKFPQLKLIISHMGFPWVHQCLAILAKCPNVYADIAGLANKPWYAYNWINTAYEFNVIDKLLLGSDWPYSTLAQTIETIYSLNKLTLDISLPSVPRETLKGIIHRDSISLLELERK